MCHHYRYTVIEVCTQGNTWRSFSAFDEEVSLEGRDKNQVQIAQITVGNDILHLQSLQACFFSSEDSHEFPSGSDREANKPGDDRMSTSAQHSACTEQWSELPYYVSETRVTHKGEAPKSHKALNV